MLLDSPKFYPPNLNRTKENSFTHRESHFFCLQFLLYYLDFCNSQVPRLPWAYKQLQIHPILTAFINYTIAYFFLTESLSEWAKTSTVVHIIKYKIKKYSHGFTRIWTIYSHGFLLAQFQKSEKSSLFPRFFLFFSRFSLSRTFFSSLFFPRMRGKNWYARKKKNLWALGALN